jgi:hypothetical protein
MITLKNTHILTVGQRKVLAVLMLATIFTNSQATMPVYAAGPIAIVEQAMAQSELETVPVVEPTVQEVLLSVCEENGYGEDCAKTLLGMLWTESSNQSTVIGDGGRARGYFQIHYRLHKIPVACAEDLVCSSQWTIDYLERNHYPKYVNYAIQCHNSCNVNNGYVAKVKRYAARFWNDPLTIDQAAPIQIAVK